MSPFYILGIETSCDESSAAVVELNHGLRSSSLLSLETFSQIPLHVPYGGVVPEVSSRSHLETLPFVVEKALKSAQISPSQLSALSVTTQPGLIGSLMVGVSFAKALAYGLKKPVFPVHHLEGHVASLWINKRESEIPLPMLCLLVSGGHTMLLWVEKPPSRWMPGEIQKMLLGASRDDAAGEAFDKVGKILGFDYPAGAKIDQTAQGGNRLRFEFPKPFFKNASTTGPESYEFSFSGLKTAARNKLNAIQQSEKNLPSLSLEDPQFKKDFCASFQESVIQSLMGPLEAAIEARKPASIGVVGGVSANSRLREVLQGISIPTYSPALRFCADNAAMIATLGAFHALNPTPRLSHEEALKLHARAYL